MRTRPGPPENLWRLLVQNYFIGRMSFRVTQPCQNTEGRIQPTFNPKSVFLQAGCPSYHQLTASKHRQPLSDRGQRHADTPYSAVRWSFWSDQPRCIGPVDKFLPERNSFHVLTDFAKYSPWRPLRVLLTQTSQLLSCTRRLFHINTIKLCLSYTASQKSSLCTFGHSVAKYRPDFS